MVGSISNMLLMIAVQASFLLHCGLDVDIDFIDRVFVFVLITHLCNP